LTHFYLLQQGKGNQTQLQHRHLPGSLWPFSLNAPLPAFPGLFFRSAVQFFLEQGRNASLFIALLPSQTEVKVGLAEWYKGRIKRRKNIEIDDRQIFVTRRLKI
jgi:hypothetical protein